MVLAVIKKTGSKEYSSQIEPIKNSFISFLGTKFEPIVMNNEFSKRNIVVLSNPLSFESGLEPNIFVVNEDNPIPCERILFGNVLFLKNENNTYIDLTEDDISFIHSYIDKCDMSEDEKAMAGLFEYDPKEVGYKFNHKVKNEG